MRLIVAQKTEFIKTAFPRSASIQAVPTRGGFQGRTKAAFISHRRCDPCSSKRYPAHCSSQPCPTRVSPAPLPYAALRSQVKIRPPSREASLCSLFTLVSLYFIVFSAQSLCRCGSEQGTSPDCRLRPSTLQHPNLPCSARLPQAALKHKTPKLLQVRSDS